MTERSALNQVVQLGVESTRGTAVAATKRLQALGIEPSPKVEMDQFRPAGQKYKAITTLGKEWTEAGLTGRGSYTEIIYPLSSVMTAANVSTPGGGTLSRKWTFTPSSTADDNPKTFTVEHGSSVRADKFTYGLITEFGMTFNRTSIECTGSMMGKALTDNIVMTAPRTVADGVTILSDATVTSATAAFTNADLGASISGVGIPVGATIITITSGTSVEISEVATAAGTGISLTIGTVNKIALVPIVPTEVSVYMDDTYAGIGGTKLTRAISAEFSLGSRYAGVYVLDAANPSFVNHIETEPDLTCNLTMQADTQGMGFLPTLRSGDTKYLRIEGVGPLIETTINYRFTLDMAVKVVDTGGFSDSDGVYAIEFNFVGVDDSTLGGAVKVEVTNTLTAL